MTTLTLPKIQNERELAKAILNLMPANEDELSLALGVSRDQVASICRALVSQKKIKVDKAWDWPRHYEGVE